MYNIYPNDLFYSRHLAFKTQTREEERRTKIEVFSKLCPIQTNKKKSHPDMYYELNDDEPIREAVTDNYYSYVTSGKGFRGCLLLTGGGFETIIYKNMIKSCVIFSLLAETVIG